MAGEFEAAAGQLAEKALFHKAVLVAYSGGKDSLVCLDLACRTFQRVVAFHMFLIPGLDVIEKQMQYARDRWGVEVLQVPHWTLFRFLRESLYCPHYAWAAGLPELWWPEIYSWVERESGIPLVVMGTRKSDSRSGRLAHKNLKRTDILTPLWEWNQFDVLAYLKTRDIPLPDAAKKETSGIDLSTQSLLWLHDNYPQDFARLLRLFPFAQAAICRRDWWGIGAAPGEQVPDERARLGPSFRAGGSSL